MTFLHFYLLGGLTLVGVPILVHLITREKPKHLRFPAFRFLVQKYHSNRRKLRLHQIILMLLRMLLIAALCVALARPLLHSDRLTFLGGKQPVLVALLVDTSPSMEYERGGLTRLEDARRRALELLEELPAGSRVALLDSADPGGQFEDPTAVREQLRELKIRHANSRISLVLKRAFSLINEEVEKRAVEGEPPPRFLYVFSDRTPASWEPAETRGLSPPEGLNVVYVDMGTDQPVDLAIEQVVVEPASVPPGGMVQVRAVVRAVGEGADRKITCQVDNDARLQEKRVQLSEGSRQTVVFDYRAAGLGKEPAREGELAPGSHQVVLRLESPDRLPFNNEHHATFVVRPGRKVLTIMDDVPNEYHPWPVAVRVFRYTGTVRSPREVDTQKLRDYDLVCLYQVRDPSALWKPLLGYVRDGGKLIVIPGGEMPASAWNEPEDAKELLPARIERAVSSDRGGGIPWDWKNARQTPLMAPFLRWRREQTNLEFWKTGGEPRVHRYWEVTPVGEKTTVVVRYDDGKNNPPAIVERDVGRGKVLLFTTKLDVRTEKIYSGENSPLTSWQNYWQTAFGPILVDLACRYMAGDSVAPVLNHVCGETVSLPLGREGGEQFILRGPGLPPQGVSLTPPEKAPDEKEPAERVLPISRAVLPGNYVVSVVRQQKTEPFEAFSMNVRPEESQLEPRLSKDDIEAVLGKDTVLSLDHNLSLRDAISRRPQPVELLPYLMLALLLVLAAENFLGNRRRDKPPDAEKAAEAATEKPPEPAPAFSWRSPLFVLLWTGLGVGVGVAVALARSLSGGVLAGAVISGLFGTFHGLLTVIRFGQRDGAILGGLLGSIAGVLYGWLILGIIGGGEGLFPVMFGLAVGATVLALDGWAIGWWNERKPAPKPKPEADAF